MQVQGQHPHQWAPFQVAGLLHAWQIPNQISMYIYHEGQQPRASTLCNTSVSCFHVILGLPGPRFSTCMSKAVLIAPLECSTCPYQRSLQNEVQIFNAKPCKQLTGSGGDNVLRLDIADLSDHCPVISLQTLEVWLYQWLSLTGMEHCAPHTRAVHVATCLEREVARRENW